MNKKRFIRLGPLLTIAVFAVMPAVAQAQPHWYKNNKIIETRVNVKTEVKLHLQVYGFEIDCRLADEEEVWNPPGGGAGEDLVTAFTLSPCKTKPTPYLLCSRPEKPEVLPMGLPWSSQLVPGSPITDEIKNIELDIKCSGGGAGDRFTGTLTPEVGVGLLNFQGNTSGFLQDGSGNKAYVVGGDKLKAPPGKITAA